MVVNHLSDYIIKHFKGIVNMKEEYFVGLDIGTDSVGWAATDKNYKLLKARGQDMWGSYLFDTAETAAQRRNFRASRRRLVRVRHRLSLLQSLFSEEINKIDPTFFIRLNDSKLLPEDKDERISVRYVLFGDANYTDKNYFKDYPTIFHLRNALRENEIRDIRLLYLAIHHIIKHRGHFLFEGQRINVNSSEIVKNSINHINTFLYERDSATLDLQNIDECLNIIKNRSIDKKSKQKQLKELFSAGSDKQLNTIIAAMTGGKVGINELYKIDADNPFKFSFEEANFEENILPKIQTQIEDDEIELILKAKSVYDWSLLSSILHGHSFISQAKIEIYDKHRNDLMLLKKYVKENCPEKYGLVFRHKKDVDNYAAYAGMDKHRGYKKTTKEKFYQFLKKTIDFEDSAILKEIESGTFLPKQITNANGVIPYQVNLAELEAILENAKKYFPFLIGSDNSLTVADKIKALMTFRIPYYVGPLNTSSRYAWAVRNRGAEKTSVTPWNFDEIIDKDASEEKFIARMTTKCTYLPSEDVLPANSLLYKKFVFLNELNNLTVFEEKNERVRNIAKKYAETHRKITVESLLKTLIKEGIVPAGTNKTDVFGGIDGDFKSNLSSYYDLKRIINAKVDTESEMCEEIIKWITLISDKNRLYARIKKTYSSKLSEAEIKSICALNYSGWGRLSKKLLTGITSTRFCDPSTGEMLNIIDAMDISGKNLMQLLSNELGYVDAIKEYNSEFNMDERVTYSTINNLYCSPSVKRAIWRTITLVREIIKIQGAPPKKIAIEMSRGATEQQKNRRTIPRKQQLLNLYKSIKDEARDWSREIAAISDEKFNSDKVFLYYLQMGRCMYTGQPIFFNDLFVKNTYDIDHIYPQAKIKDDSLDNRVLVNKQDNASKTDVYPIDQAVRAKMLPFWKILKGKGLLASTKYARLVRNAPLSIEEMADFIQRQLVETRQSTKLVASILKSMYPSTEIVYSKARNAADFKNELELVKVRELNNLHHAKDAYINIVVGNVLTSKYGNNPIVFFRSRNEKDYNIRKPFSKDIPGAWSVSMKNDIIHTYNKNTCSVVRFSSEESGALFNATIKSAGENDNLIPLKASGPIANTDKYGGYDSATTAYFALVKSEGKKRLPLLSLECVPVYIEKIIGGDKTELTKYFAEKQGLVNPEIIIDKIKINTLFKINGSYAYLRGRTGNRVVWCNANELILDLKSTKYLKHITSYFDGIKKLGKEIPVDPIYDKITAEENIMLYNTLLEKLSSKTYSGLPSSRQHDFLSSKTDAFAALNLTDQCKIIIQVLKLMQTNSALSDFRLLNGVANAGANFTSKYIQDLDLQIIYRSPTGYYTKILDVNKLK